MNPTPCARCWFPRDPYHQRPAFDDHTYRPSAAWEVAA